MLLDDLQRYDFGRFTVRDDLILGGKLDTEYTILAQCARNATGVLIVGETGTGKTPAARHYHASATRPGQFVYVNCASLERNVADAMLFGAKKGAFTDVAESNGFFAQADGGTLFLDEIATLPLEVQAKLLVVLQEKMIRQLGADRLRKVDVRVVCATNADLQAAVAAGKFREDLLARIAQETIRLPPLRERREEIPWLLAMHAGELELGADFVEACLLYEWPTNVRELENVMKRLRNRAAVEKWRVLDAQHLREMVDFGGVATVPAAEEVAPQEPHPEAADQPEDPRFEVLKHQYATLGKTHRAAAAAAGIPVGTAYRWLTKARLLRPT